MNSWLRNFFEFPLCAIARWRTFLFLLLLPVLSSAQFSDNFLDGDFTNNPAWIGNTTSFDISTAMLHSNGPQASSVIYLSTASTLIDSAEWNFLIRLDFNPSSTNQVRVFLVSDQQDLSGSLNGYFVQFGESGTNPDSLDIFRQNGTTVTKVFSGSSGCMGSTSSNSVRVRVVRHTGGTWDVYADCSGGTNLLAEGSFTDNLITTTNYFGVVCDYSTATRYNLYYFDDFAVSNIVTDTTRPYVESVTVLSSSNIDVKFTEPVETVSSQTTGNYTIDNSIGNPASAIRDVSDKSLVHLTLANALQNGTNYVLSISNVKDFSANTMNAYTFPFSFYNAGVYDVLIHEIFADPDPQVALPLAEFVELHNQTAFPISLNGWVFSDGSSNATITSGTILPDSFVILCKTDSFALFQPYGSVIALNNFPSLNNTSDNLTLKNQFGTLIHSVSYTDDWYKDDAKKDGGWTLEMIDAQNPCNGKDNWMASADASGGTPGRSNSVSGVNPDTIAPKLIRAALVANNAIELYFSEPVQVGAASVASNYSVNNGSLVPLTALPQAPDFDKVQLQFAQNFSVGVIYYARAFNLSDCSGNPVSSSDSVRFAIPDSVVAGDIVINEILFNPKTGGYDFVELYNRSNKIIDLNRLDILEMDAADPLTTVDETAITPESYLLFPQEYVVLTENTENIAQNYTVENSTGLLEVPGLPNFPDDEGICVLRLHNSATIDSLSFSNKWHFALLDDEDGVSLERIDFNQPTQTQSNWHSAASTVGFATPTYLNSQFSETGITDDAIVIDPEVFTPDNDGVKDFTHIVYEFSEAGYSANVRIYDGEGREIKNLVRNELLGSKGQFQWDGTDDDFNKARTGIYIAHVEVFNLQGKVKRFKKQLVLGAKLN